MENLSDGASYDSFSYHTVFLKAFAPRNKGGAAPKVSGRSFTVPDSSDKINIGHTVHGKASRSSAIEFKKVAIDTGRGANMRRAQSVTITNVR
jgi:hypothetical protein